MKERVRNPLIPGNPRERTGCAGILRRANAEITKRFPGLTRDVLEVFSRIPTYATNDDKGTEDVLDAVTHYGATPQVLDQTMLDLQAALDRWITGGRETKYVAWWDVYEQEAAQLGTAQSAANLANLSPVYAAARSLEMIVFSEPYRLRAELARQRSNEYWTGLALQARADLAGVIGRAVVDGKNPKAVRTEIMERLGVSRARRAIRADRCHGYAQGGALSRERGGRGRARRAHRAAVDFGLPADDALMARQPQRADLQPRGGEGLLQRQRKSLPLSLCPDRGAARRRRQADPHEVPAERDGE